MPMGNSLLVQPAPAGCPLLPFPARSLPQKSISLPHTPVVLLPRPPLLPLKPRPILPILLMLRCVIPFLDSYEVIYTTKSFYAQRTFTAAIFDWHVTYIRRLHSGFVPDPLTRTVRTSTGRTVCPDPGTINYEPASSFYAQSLGAETCHCFSTPGPGFHCLLLLWLPASY